jgi:hypothetical protein
VPLTFDPGEKRSSSTGRKTRRSLAMNAPSCMCPIRSSATAWAFIVQAYLLQTHEFRRPQSCVLCLWSRPSPIVVSLSEMSRSIGAQ